jgi:hypothetical protein
MRHIGLFGFFLTGLMFQVFMGMAFYSSGSPAITAGTLLWDEALFINPGNDSIRMIYPENVIVDPHSDTIGFYFYNPELFWGDDGNYFDTVIRISANQTFEWYNVNIKDVIDNKYLCTTHDKITLPDTSNTIYFRMEWEVEGNRFDTIFTESVRYCKPMVEVQQVDDVTPYDGSIVVVNEPSINIKLNVLRSFDYSGPTINDKIKSIEYRLNDDPYEDLIAFTPVINGLSIDTLLEIPLLHYGINTLEFRANGKHKLDLPEYSEIRKVTLFYLDFDLGDLPDDTVCALDKNFELRGLPAGGYFSGSGIIDQTNVFNPSLADPGTNLITYHYQDFQVNASVTHPVTVDPIPDFDLIGDREVCFNEYDVFYEITGVNLEGCAFTWDLTNGEVLDTQDNTHFSVHWGDPGTGRIKLELVYKNNPACDASREYIIDIDPTKAPDPSFISLHNGNLLVCSDPTANVYHWYKNDQLIVTDYPENNPYLLLTGSNLPSGSGTSDYHVETAFVANSHSCFTESHHYIYSATEKNLEYGNDLHLTISPNPADKSINFSVYPLQEGDYFYELVDLAGKILMTDQVYFNQNGFSPSLDIQNISPGIYLVRLVSRSSSLIEKIIVY